VKKQVMRKTMRGLPPDLERQRNLGETAIDYLMINLRGVCDYSCLKCFADRPPIDQPALTQRQISELISQAADLGARVVVVAGEGEPLLAAGLQEVVELNANLGLRTVLFTNGLHLDRDMAEFFSDNGCSVIISCDSLKSDVYRVLTGGCSAADFDRVMSNIDEFRSILRKTVEVADGLQIVRGAINMTVTLLAEHELPDMRAFCGDDFLLVCNSVAPQGRAKEALQQLCGSAEDIVRLREIAAAFSQTGGPSAACRDGKCGYLFHGVAVSSEGSILPCAYTQDLGGALGNVASLPLDKALASVNRFKKQCFDRYGRSTCIIRHGQYERMIADSQPNAVRTSR
jgi:MoaA/NifB/PqqE/SkfB family radical SAM enzyme